MVRNERGVTLVELIIALAIAGLLAFSILFGRDNLLARTQFSQGVDQIVTTLSDARNQTSSGTGQTAVSPLNVTSGGPNVYVYGKTVEMNAWDNYPFTVSTELVTNAQPASTGTVWGWQYDAYYPGEFYDTTPDYGANNNYDFLFAFQPGGMVKAYYKFGGSSSGPSLIPMTGDPATGSMAAVPPAGISFNVVDDHGDTATITVDQYGNVTRTIN